MHPKKSERRREITERKTCSALTAKGLEMGIWVAFLSFFSHPFFPLLSLSSHSAHSRLLFLAAVLLLLLRQCC